MKNLIKNILNLYFNKDNKNVLKYIDNELKSIEKEFIDEKIELYSQHFNNREINKISIGKLLEFNYDEKNISFVDFKTFRNLIFSIIENYIKFEYNFDNCLTSKELEEKRKILLCDLNKNKELYNFEKLDILITNYYNSIINKNNNLIKNIQKINDNLYLNEHLTIVGETGSGKSTINKNIIKQIIKNKNGFINIANNFEEIEYVKNILNENYCENKEVYKLNLTYTKNTNNEDIYFVDFIDFVGIDTLTNILYSSVNESFYVENLKLYLNKMFQIQSKYIENLKISDFLTKTLKENFDITIKYINENNIEKDKVLENLFNLKMDEDKQFLFFEKIYQKLQKDILKSFFNEKKEPILIELEIINKQSNININSFNEIINLINDLIINAQKNNNIIFIGKSKNIEFQKQNILFDRLIYLKLYSFLNFNFENFKEIDEINKVEYKKLFNDFFIFFEQNEENYCFQEYLIFIQTLRRLNIKTIQHFQNFSPSICKCNIANNKNDLLINKDCYSLIINNTTLIYLKNSEETTNEEFNNYIDNYNKNMNLFLKHDYNIFEKEIQEKYPYLYNLEKGKGYIINNRLNNIFKFQITFEE